MVASRKPPGVWLRRNQAYLIAATVLAVAIVPGVVGTSSQEAPPTPPSPTPATPLNVEITPATVAPTIQIGPIQIEIIIKRRRKVVEVVVVPEHHHEHPIELLPAVGP